MQLLQLNEGSAFVRSRCSRSSYIEHDGPAEPRIVAGASELVENGPCATGPIALVIVRRAGDKFKLKFVLSGIDSGEDKFKLKFVACPSHDHQRDGPSGAGPVLDEFGSSGDNSWLCRTVVLDI